MRKKSLVTCPDVSVGLNNGNLRLLITGRLYEDKKQRFIALRSKDNDENRLAAQMRQIEIQTEINSGAYDPTLNKYRIWHQDKKPKYLKASMTIEQLWDYWCIYMKPSLAPSTYNQKFEGTYSRAITGVGAERIVAPGTAWHTRRWLLANLNHQDSYNLLAHLEHATAHAINDGRIQGNNPWLGMAKALRSKRENRIDKRNVHEAISALSQRNYYTASERDAILDIFAEAFPHYWLFTYFRFWTGCRFEESIGIEWQDITDDCSSILFRRSYSETGGCIKTTKMGKARRFNCPPHLQGLLLEHRKQSFTSDTQIVFTNSYGTRVTIAAYKKPWNRIVKHLYEEGILGVCLSLKYTRHTLSNLAREAGVDERSVTQQMGHTARVRDEHYLDRSRANSEIMAIS